MNKILYFFPHKFSNPTDGIYTRVISLLEYFKSRGYLVDMVCFDNDENSSSYILDLKLVNSICFLDTIKPKNDYKVESSYTRLIKKIENKIFPKPPAVIKELPTWNSKKIIQKLIELNSLNQYDFFLSTYSYSSRFAESLKSSFSGKMVLDLNDFGTLQLTYSNIPKLSFTEIGSVFASELSLVQIFDEVIHISYDESLLFSSFLPNLSHSYIPQCLPIRFSEIEENEIYQYDLLFVGSNNPYNIEGVNWFLQQVYPLLEKELKIAFVGKICDSIDASSSTNVHKLGFVEDLEKAYKSTRCTFCPLLRGTGMKIKVVESLSYGIPVVSTLKGVDGFMNKLNEGVILVANTPLEFAQCINKITSKGKDLLIEQKRLTSKLFLNNFSEKIVYSKLDEIFN